MQETQAIAALGKGYWIRRDHYLSLQLLPWAVVHQVSLPARMFTTRRRKIRANRLK